MTRERYSKPIYGGDIISSSNFQNWQWIQFNDQGYLVEPYRLLPKLFQDTSNSDMLLTGEEYIADGGAALTAYARMQFSEMTDYERKELSSALLKYCELDTLAMVMIYEAWKEIISA